MFLRVREVQELLGVSKTWVFDRLKSGRLTAKRDDGRVVVILRESVDRYVESMEDWKPTS